ncbi:anthranilate synthase component I family protein [Flagellimonas myxillae]|uniref:anthranilate synthase component I family protein n=1 Tax=Flagellimonas myxillae TaxID=2942214 RepID=UPI00201F01AD|nr:anthranilate synthase component I family protein [Muricauda myxillae]MCL6265767.1 anthranilate synthase component I family protein [Muricauda myxillae]
MREQRSFPVVSSKKFKNALLEWSRHFENVAWLDSNNHSDSFGKFDAILAINGQNDKSEIPIKTIDKTADFIDKRQDWLFGYISYDFKNQLENLYSHNHDGLEFPEIHFFQPSKIILLRDGELQFLYMPSVSDDIPLDFEALQKLSGERSPAERDQQSVRIKLRIHKDAYFEKANRFLHHIQRGDIYEANFCQEFYAEDTTIDPWETYKNLNRISTPPFASFLRLEDKYLLCASPERYLCKRGRRVVSQPIKGTAPRGENAMEDIHLMQTLELDIKERTENIMITDLVRNDLSKSALKGSVEVKELCKVYPFKQVHQMISTIVSEVPENFSPIQLIKDTFPMGSMTGAPKVSAMKIIEEQEETKRGLYSGAVGYFDPEGNFDFNVVIRSILYNATKKYVSFSVGSAITSKSDPEREYQECLLKAKAMRSVLEGS